MVKETHKKNDDKATPSLLLIENDRPHSSASQLLQCQTTKPLDPNWLLAVVGYYNPVVYLQARPKCTQVKALKGHSF